MTCTFMANGSDYFCEHSITRVIWLGNDMRFYCPKHADMMANTKWYKGEVSPEETALYILTRS